MCERWLCPISQAFLAFFILINKPNAPVFLIKQKISTVHLLNPSFSILPNLDELYCQVNSLSNTLHSNSTKTRWNSPKPPCLSNVTAVTNSGLVFKVTCKNILALNAAFPHWWWPTPPLSPLLFLASSVPTSHVFIIPVVRVLVGAVNPLSAVFPLIKLAVSEAVFTLWQLSPVPLSSPVS